MTSLPLQQIESIRDRIAPQSSKAIAVSQAREALCQIGALVSALGAIERLSCEGPNLEILNEIWGISSAVKLSLQALEDRVDGICQQIEALEATPQADSADRT